MTGQEMWQRTHMCADITSAVGHTVILNGWVQRRRDHGGLIFADVRDRSGIVQVVFSPDIGHESFSLAESIRTEYVVAVTGLVRDRPADTTNDRLLTGALEVLASDVIVLNPAKTPPFYIEDDVEVDETVRLKYRYLDLRRPRLQQNIIMRHKAVKQVRDYLDRQGFLEIETPILAASTPEGARDFLVPSRLNPGKFYGLPQSPQLFKQLLMVAGMERYFQVARCFRDEDLRADRQPEFTQIDIEMSFVTQEDIMTLIENMVAEVLEIVFNRPVTIPFDRITYDQAMRLYGTDKPDLRFGLQLVDLAPAFENTEIMVFKQILDARGIIRGIMVPGGSRFTRKELDDLTAVVTSLGARGLAWIAFEPDGKVRSPLANALSGVEIDDLRSLCSADEGDLLLAVAADEHTTHLAMDQLRQHLGRKLGLIDEEMLALAWVTDFPLFEWSEEDKRYVAKHHPFTSPMDADLGHLESEPSQVRAKAYDLVLNGVELGGGSIRIHQREIQERMFKALGFTAAEATQKFGFLMEAFEYGTPPHGGIALGLDRMIMILMRQSSIRDVITFPKTASGTCLLTDAPVEVSPRQLSDLKIKLST